jgi:nucleoside-diphosphate-sugar epimerase
MKVFVTGASGFIGSAIVKELLAAGHEVIGLARSEESAKTITVAGAQVLMGSIEDLDVLRQGAFEADGVIHMAYSSDLTQFEKAGEMDKAAINTIGEALAGTNKPMVVPTGILGYQSINGAITEESGTLYSPRTSEPAALALAEKGINASVVRLPPSVHDKGDRGFISFIIHLARKNNASAYPAEGNIRWSSVHRLDAARAFRLALEKAEKGAKYNAIGESGVEVKKMAEVIGDKLGLPVVSLSKEDIEKHFEWMSMFITFDSYATGFKTEEELGWKPTHIGLLEDMQENYF